MSIYTTPAPKRTYRGSGVRINGDVLRVEFAKRLWTIRKAAQVMGLHETTLYEALKGEKAAQATVEKILRALEENPPSAAAESLLA